MWPRAVLGLAVPAAVLVAALAGCSSSSNTAVGTSAASTSAAAGSSSSPASSSAPSATSASVAPGRASSPADAVTGYFAAAKANDCPAAFAFLTDPIKTTIGSAATLCQSLQSAPVVNLAVGATNQTDATTAVVTATVTLGGGSAGTYTDAVTTVNQNGVWFVSAIKRQ